MTRWRPAIVLAMAAVVVGAGWVLYGTTPISGRVTAYYATCLRRDSVNRCLAIGRTFEPSVFRVSGALQRVESLDANGEVRRLRSCTVRSRTEWHCLSASDDAIEVGFSGGRPLLRVGGAMPPDLVFLPRWKYLWLRFGESRPVIVPRARFGR